MSVKFKINIPKFYKGKIFIDPLEEIEGTLNVTIFQFDKILYFSKRTGFDRYQAYVKRHNFIIPNGRQVLDNANLKEEEYLELLLSKSKSIQEKVRYAVKEECIEAENLNAIARNLGILEKENEEIIELILGVYKKDGYKQKNN